MQERIQKILAAAGVASRRKCEELIAEGRVKVNGKIAKLGEKASPEDRITIDDKPVRQEKQVYLIFNKPSGYVTTLEEEYGMPTIMELVKVPQRVYPAGRLDRDAEGLLILTNDGELANGIMHPKHNLEKQYLVRLEKPLDSSSLRKINAKPGMRIEGRPVDCRAFMLGGRNIRITIHEGRKHIIKRIFERLGYNVVKLVRERIGPIKLEGVLLGKWRHLSNREVDALRRELAK